MSNPFAGISIGGNYVKLKEVNDSVTGTIVSSIFLCVQSSPELRMPFYQAALSMGH